MSDHYHYASEVQGVAEDSHRHTARDVGAAEDHDLTMLERRVQDLEGELRHVREEHRALLGNCRELQQTVVSLTETVISLTGSLGTLAGDVETVLMRGTL